MTRKQTERDVRTRRPHPTLKNRNMRHRPAAILISLVLGLRSLVGCAQPADLSVVGALSSVNEGRYSEARALLKPHLETPDTTGSILIGYLETFRAVGEYETGLREADALLAATGWQRADDGSWSGPQSGRLRASFLQYMRGRFLAATGRYDEADAAHREAARLRRNYWRNAIELATLMIERGQLREAFQINGAIFSAYKQGYFRTSEQLAIAGRAAAFVQEFHDANTAHRTASQVDPRNFENLYWWAELFRQKYNDADAQATLEDAIQINDRAHWLFVSLARTGSGFAQREALSTQALELNPRSVGALSVLASVRLLDGDDAGAERAAREALQVNPQSLDALAQLASVQYVRGDTSAYAETAAAALEVNPGASGFFVDVAENLALRFRYPDAVELSRVAVRNSPRDPEALANLGINLMRAGRFDEAQRYLESSFERDEFNVFVGNTLTLLDAYDDFSRLHSPHFELLVHNDEAQVIGPLLLQQAEAAYRDMSERYGYRPQGKILLEAYNDKDDFAVRIAGLPHLGLLGVSFGDVVALNTPRALAGDLYNWARTLRHELAHTMAIGVSDYRVPRWFTEGLSVYEEKRLRPDWAREMDLELYAAMDRDKLHSLENMDRGFTRPEFPGQVLLSYYHASRIVEYLVDRFGFESIVEILNGLRAGRDIAASLEAATGLSTVVLDANITAALEAERDEVNTRLGGLPDVLAADNSDASVGGDTYGGRQRDRLSVTLREAHEMLERGETTSATQRFESALGLFPAYVGPGNAYLALAGIYRESGDMASLADILERYLAVSDYGVAEARELADMYERSGRLTDAIALLERSTEVDPYDRETRSRLATHYLATGRPADAVGERRAILALDPVDRAEAYYRLGDALYRNSDFDLAKRATLQALEIAPGHRDAQRLLLVCVERESATPGM